ncbi:uncharacterized protein MELLADRAFT_107744 [Melampsora larici-populina 98AG31]|uniref:Uncharacterized protein n=1 Tax=Melampsora larici-populina (strain 98AG31 / pathotype 3-4-7) TaxID=747676 RepID=F4RQT4_MELLP|nr:uncharacterized protein MELLADRAFT_107744 [Melampsora larici-populina 98AG31]EGG05268.1 hypothetical protein MELLADRAFT_107744 [Melampsora larici-populina 98AG31]
MSSNQPNARNQPFASTENLNHKFKRCSTKIQIDSRISSHFFEHHGAAPTEPSIGCVKRQARLFRFIIMGQDLLGFVKALLGLVGLLGLDWLGLGEAQGFGRPVWD